MSGDYPNLRLEIKARNNVLWHAIFDNYTSVAEFCRATGHMTDGWNSSISTFLNLTQSPFSKLTMDYKQSTLEISNALGIPADILFPKALYENVDLPKKAVMEVDVKTLSLQAAEREVRSLPEGETAVERVWLRKKLDEVFHTLTPREATVIKDHFGLTEDGLELTNVQIAEKLGLSSERTRQILEKALKKLRHPSRAKRLQGFDESPLLEP